MTTRAAAWWGVGVLVVVAAGFAGRTVIARRAEAGLFRPVAGAPTTPADAHLRASAFRIPRGDHTLEAWLVPGGDSARSAVLIFHGNGSSLADQIPVLQVLAQHGVTAMTFDYSGYGTSGGRPSIDQLRGDAIAAVRAFTDSTGSLKRYALGTTLGAAVLLSAVDSVQQDLDGVILVGAFASARHAAVDAGKVPRALAFLMPDFYDNVAAVRRLTRPLLVIHSVEDRVVPITEAERLLGAAAGPKQFARLLTGRHDDYLASTSDWSPVLRFIGAR